MLLRYYRKPKSPPGVLLLYGALSSPRPAAKNHFINTPYGKGSASSLRGAPPQFLSRAAWKERKIPSLVIDEGGSAARLARGRARKRRGRRHRDPTAALSPPEACS